MMESEHTGIPAVDRVVEKIVEEVALSPPKPLATILEELKKVEEEEDVEYTCCGDEVVGWVEDYRICPTCKEHI